MILVLNIQTTYLKGGLNVSASEIDFTNLPTSEPNVVGRLWRDVSGYVKVKIQ